MSNYAVRHVLGRAVKNGAHLESSVWKSVGLRARSTVAGAAGVQEDALHVKAAPVRDAEWDAARPYSEMPGPKPLPFLGNLWRFFPLVGDLSTVPQLDILKKFYDDYGSISKLVGMPGKNDQIFLCDPEAIEKVFRHEGPWPTRTGIDSLDYYRRLRPQYFQGAMGLATTQGKEWADFRSAVNQTMMQPKNTKMYVPGINEVTEMLIARMRKIRDEKLEMPSDFINELNKWSLESITYIALDKSLGCLPNDLDPNSEAQQMINTVHKIFDAMFKLDIRPSLWKWVSTPAYRTLIKSLDSYYETCWKHIKTTMDRLQALTPEEREVREYSVLEKLLIKNDNPRIAVTMALDMLVAGVDTTSNASANIIYYIASNPEKQRILQKELDRVYPDPSKPITPHQLENLKYMKACIKEGMRLGPVVIGTLRTTIKDMVISGYQVPKGVDVLFDLMDMGQQEKHFHRAKEFLPERWLPGAENEDLKPKNPFTFLPFGFGPRMCVGRRFADLEMEVLIAKLFRNFNVEWHYGPLKKRMHLVIAVESPLKFKCIDRH